MARAIWSGAISFGLVSVPVKLYSAVSRKTVRFNQLDSETNSRVRQKRVNAEGDEVPYEQIVKGYEVAKDTYVVVTDEELATLSPKASRMIDITDFVSEAEIDPVFYDSAYYLVPDELARKSYALLTKAMADSGRVAIASFVMRTKQYLAAIRPVDGKLILSTMVYADEIVAPSEVELFDGLGDVDVSDKEIEMARQLISSLEADFEPDKHTDTYRLAVLDLIDRKASGEETVVVAAADDDTGGTVVDLMAALEASVAEAKNARSRHPTAKAAAEESDEAPAKKSAAKKKTAAKKAPAKKKAAAKKSPKKTAAKKKAPAKKAS